MTALEPVVVIERTPIAGLCHVHGCALVRRWVCDEQTGPSRPVDTCPACTHELRDSLERTRDD